MYFSRPIQWYHSHGDSIALQIIFDLCIPEKELEPKLVPKFHLYISKVIHDILSGTR
jgi:hypothetical protein